ncbi:50S ribosomal protein L18 [Rudanella paleaurantiibacter]|jgi:large subunit ribosomal protein L18|uniref:Large ribosomal subunit protein uL18 n=1 Tax=Rudanella paleaurantiibacter TaxID=2614655 RepID=A0A7J5TX52_9BACT|nr:MULTISPECIES: 50S ribosomal protein L18 [Rudanella]KAB7729214.1 50S ribosomal protein L18 [Rudanella paleaurantiibacter]
MATNKTERRQRIKYSIRAKVSGTAERPRLSVFRSNKAIYAQLIDDAAGHTLVAASSVELKSEASGFTVDVAKEVGKRIAEKAASKNITAVVFDRNGYLYHGKVKALADGAREGGLKF